LLTIQNSKFKIKDIFRRREVPCAGSPRCGNFGEFKPRLKMILRIDVGVLNPFIYDKY